MEIIHTITLTEKDIREIISEALTDVNITVEEIKINHKSPKDIPSGAEPGHVVSMSVVAKSLLAHSGGTYSTVSDELYSRVTSSVFLDETNIRLIITNHFKKIGLNVIGELEITVQSENEPDEALGTDVIKIIANFEK